MQQGQLPMRSLNQILDPTGDPRIKPYKSYDSNIGPMITKANKDLRQNKKNLEHQETIKKSSHHHHAPPENPLHQSLTHREGKSPPLKIQ